MSCVTFTACALLAVSLGCKDEKPKPPPAPVDGIEIVKPGAEPRVELRYRLAKTEPSKLDLAMDIDLETSGEKVVLPTIAMGIDLAIATVDPGTALAKVQMTVVSSGARARAGSDDPELVKLMDRQTAQLVGLVISYALSPAGVVTNSKVDASPRDLSGPMQEQVTMLLQMTEQLAMPMPEQPIGAGAVWKHRRTMRQNQLTFVTMTTVEVKAIDGNAVTFASTTEMTGADQTLTQGGATAKVTGARGTGSQTGTLDLAKAIVHGEARATLEFQMIVDGQVRPTKMDMITRFAPRAEAEEPVPDDAGITDDSVPAVDAAVPAD